MDKTPITPPLKNRPKTLPKRRPISGSQDTFLPERYTYWRVGYSNQEDYPLINWIHHCGEYVTKEGYKTGDFHWEHTTQIYYHYDGAAYAELDGNHIDLEIGDLFIVPENTSFSYGSADAKESIGYHWISLAGTWPELLGEEASTLYKKPGLDKDLLNLFESIREVAIWQKTAYPLQAIGLFYQLLAKVEELCAVDTSGQLSRSSYPEKLRRAMNFLIDNYTSHYKTEEVTNVANISESHLRTLFRQWLGESPREFHKRHRMNRACHLLRTHNLRVAEVAQSIGFDDVHHFSRVFKQVVGVTPSSYRRNPY